ncbi:DedA family protein [Curtobacterium ammoniigenes]|uniref:DedA family protein n=1 Tax=Curtobacterium ammoniigenes TaxID=395387 RepID=UPI000B0671F3|nr:DedA family protein [Curtobacterium ammoniigenes]
MPLTMPMVSILNASSLLHAFGPAVLIGIAVVIFIESGILFPFLPGDSLLVTGAILAGALNVQIWEIIVVAIVAAFLGDQAGFWLGRRFGRRLFRDNARVLKTERLRDAEAFFAKYGPASLVIGRFVPIIRTYVPLAAGTARLSWPRFVRWNAIGGVGWVIVMVFVGVFLGKIPFVANNIDALSVVIVIVSVLPIVIGGLRARSKAKAAARAQVDLDEADAQR